MSALPKPQKESRQAELVELLAELLRRGEAIELQARGGSMYPMIRDGDRLRIEPVQADQLRRGDVIAYRRGGRLLVHRYLGRWPDSRALRARGDSHARVEPPLDPSAVLGRVSAIGRHGRKLRLDHGAWRAVGLLLQPLFSKRAQLKEWLQDRISSAEEP